ncbi:hypothetical protein EV363DRAFT_1175903, partial [Boletus edulis]
IDQGRGGYIIGAGDLSGRVGVPLLCAYSARKFAVRALTLYAALELCRLGYNITVNSYAPVSLIRQRVSVGRTSDPTTRPSVDSGPRVRGRWKAREY